MLSYNRVIEMMNEKDSFLKKLRDVNSYVILIIFLPTIAFLIFMYYYLYAQNFYMLIISIFCLIFFLWLAIKHNNIYLAFLKFIFITAYHSILFISFNLAIKGILKVDAFSNFVIMELVILMFIYLIKNLYKSVAGIKTISVFLRKINEISQFIYIRKGSPFFKYIIFLTVSFSACALMEYLSVNEIVTKSIIFVLLLITYFEGYEFKETKNLSYELFNLKYNDLLDNNMNLYIEDFYNQDSEGRLLKIKIDTINNNEVKSLKILNHFYVNFKNDTSKNNTNYFYYYVSGFFFISKSNLKLLIKTNENTYIVKMKLELSTLQDEIIINDFYYSWSKTKISFDKKKELQYHGKFSFSKILKRNYEVSILNDDLFKESSFDTRKWLLHKGSFGTGKTTLDILSLNNLGYIPIIISPWEDNYDDDFLYLIFDKMKKKSKKIFFLPERHTFIIFIVSVFAVFTALYTMLNSIDNFSKVNHLVFFNLTSYTYLCIYLLILFISFMSILYLLPYLIIFKKNSSRIYQDFYLNNIKYMLNRNSKLILLVEDIDRLDPKYICDILRILSKLNNSQWNSDRKLGIISCNHKVIENHDMTFNKIACGELFADVKSRKYMWKFLRKSLEALERIKKMSFHIEYSRISEENFISDISFRLIKDTLEKLINAEDNEEAISYLNEILIID